MTASIMGAGIQLTQAQGTGQGSDDQQIPIQESGF